MLFGLLLALVLVLSPVVALGLIVWQHRRLSELQSRVRALEGGERGLAASAGQEVSAAPRREQAEVLLADLARPATADAEPVDWEQLIGRRALGWVAVCLLLGAVAFFLRFAYDNLWIGPQGQVGIGILAGLALVLAGWRYHRWQWFRFSQMLSAAGIVALYLSIYSSYAFYHLLPQQIASVCMLVVILQAAVVAVLYAAPILAWTSMLGGLVTPVLMGSEVDRYPEFFSYLVALNLGVLVISRVRRWSGLGTAALLATHGLFWLWYERWYHPEKLAGALRLLRRYDGGCFLDAEEKRDVHRAVALAVLGLPTEVVEELGEEAGPWVEVAARDLDHLAFDADALLRMWELGLARVAVRGAVEPHLEFGDLPRLHERAEASGRVDLFDVMVCEAMPSWEPRRDRDPRSLSVVFDALMRRRDDGGLLTIYRDHLETWAHRSAFLDRMIATWAPERSGLRQAAEALEWKPSGEDQTAKAWLLDAIDRASASAASSAAG